ncbi:MAG: DNA translocase FtsK [Paludibacteraceae bacterium]|nr:DNA translocase FtsK [Paludibacteraceae bacterium]
MATRRPKRPQRQQDIEVVEEQKPSRLNLQSAKRIGEWAGNERVQLVAGIVLSAFVIYISVAFLSYFFTGKADASLMEQTGESWRALRHGIRNWTGPEGAAIINFLIDKTFGLASVSLLVFMTIWALRLTKLLPSVRGWRLLFCSAFWLGWGSLALAFIQRLFHAETFFRWGGAHGEMLCNWLTSYVQIIGVLLLLIATLLIFFICIDKNTIPNLQRFELWVVGLFKRKPKTDGPVENDLPLQPEGPVNSGEPADSDSDPSKPITFNLDEGGTVEITDTPVKGPEPAEAGDNGFNINIGGSDDELIEEPADPQTTESKDTNAPTGAETEDPDLDINDPVEEELSESDPDYWLKKLGPYDPRLDLSHFKFPASTLLKVYDNETSPVVDMEEQNANKDNIVQAFRNFGIEIKSISATVGPTVTLYEIVPKEGIKISRITSLENDIMMSLSAKGIRMIAPMPGKGTVGIEVPNKKPQVVSMHSVIASRKFQEEQKMRLPVVMGKTITNEIFMFDLAKTPHLLVAGATGQGKSVGLNAIITSLLYKKHPSELKFVLVDPKMVEFSIYEPLEKYYMAAMPEYENIIITESTKVINTLNSLVIEMENRYLLLKDARCRNLEEYNEKFVSRRLNPEKDVLDSTGKPQHHRFLPYLVIIIDEFGDFIMVAGKEVERPIARIAQKARAVGMHMILATQRPSVNIITGTIKANIPTRIAFRTQSVVDSRTVLDAKGAEGLVGKGDMLYSGGTETLRIQCAFVDTPEVEAIVKHISEQQSYSMPYELPEYIGEQGEGGEAAPGSVDLKKLDPMFTDVARFVVQNQQGSTSVLQRKFQIGYNRAGKLTDQLEAAGIVGPNNGPKGRAVLVQDEGTLEQILMSLG